MQEPFDRPKLTKIINDKHSEFIESFASDVDKTVADKRWQTEKINAKVKLVLRVFMENGIIDDIVEAKQSGYPKLTIQKSFSNNYVTIWIVDNNIILTTDNVDEEHKR